MITSCSTMSTTSIQRSRITPPFSLAEWNALLKHLRDKHTETTRLLTEDPNLPGLIGNVAGNRVFGATPDLRILPQGDGGIDLMIELLTRHRGPRFFKQDNKATPFGDCLRVEPHKIKPDKIYVLVYVPFGVTDKDWDAGEVLGWESGTRLMRIKPENRFGTGKLHIKDLPLRPMSDLLNLYTGRWCHPCCPIQTAKPW